MVGATDSHTGLTTAEEENYFGKSTSAEPTPTRISHPFVSSKLGAIEGYELAASGYQGVWASENTREAIFDAMERKETYATTGPRIAVRFFGGWNYTDQDLRSRAPAFRGYEKGVPMGGELNGAEGKAPTFMVTGFLLILIHVLISFMLFSSPYYGHFYSADGTLTGVAGLSMLAGVLGLVFLWAYNLSFQTKLSEDARFIEVITSRSVLIWALLLGGVHLLFMGYAGWLKPGGWHGGLPPISLVAFAFFLVGYLLNLFGRE